jgi:flagellar basal-body rod protein FlgC
MSLGNIFDITASAMTANRFWLERISNNMANATTTRTAAGGPYQREVPVFQQILDAETQAPMGVQATGVVKDQSAFPRVYNPGHPDADAQGFVTMPNVNVINEMVDMIAAQRNFEANITVSSAVKNMMNKAIEIGR